MTGTEDHRLDMDDNENRYICGDLFRGLKDLATNVMPTHNVDFIVSPHVCKTKKDWTAFAQAYALVLLHPVTDYYAERHERAEAETCAQTSIHAVIQDLVSQDKIVQPNLVLTPDAGPIDMAHIISSGYGRHTWYQSAHDGDNTLFTPNLADIAPMTNEAAFDMARLEAIKDHCDRYQEMRSLINWIGVRTPGQQQIATRLTNLIETDYKGPAVKPWPLPQ